ncbi:LLM class flavin-dependent oxidoreductase (plasmid) [Pseudonocardia bannensis]|uniref:LLM class flavin-dependent oxidoreductase n=1 Tax=Pseudonocardia bannensis TaxID=630973 RepID=A0A848DNS4_9PSEU|nr:LLM class flavin-dependent oxidoreductase [Pseudonocardia bannensis]NMH94358.1 LLM class flavin-dependent oxidoreductase [Pseudonocardia bannensis]
MPNEILLNAFDMNCMAHQSFGLWRHPRDRSVNYKTTEYWTDLAQTLERGLFDGLFLADVLGTYDVYGGSPGAAIRTATQIPVNDPTLVIPPMAMVTENLCFGVTGTLSYESPVPFARRMSTLDHLTGGRVGWNVVTGYLQSAAKGTGQVDQSAHDTRYDIAEEYMEIMYKLWEASWSENAVRLDRKAGVFADPDRIEQIKHDGLYLSIDSPHLCEPSPQRTPILYQAGSSPKGRSFAAKHAECVFVVGPSTAVLTSVVADLRQRATDGGRDPADLKIFAMMTVIVAPTDEEAQAKLADYQRYVSHESALAVLSGWTGIDFSHFSLDDKLTNSKVEGIQGVMDAFTADPGRVWTIREIAEKIAIGGPSPVVVGSPTTVVNEMERWVRETDVDGFNLARVVAPETFVDVVDLVVPEMQSRGIYKREYRPGTYREKLYGRGPHLTTPHPGSAYHR